MAGKNIPEEWLFEVRLSESERIADEIARRKPLYDEKRKRFASAALMRD